MMTGCTNHPVIRQSQARCVNSTQRYDRRMTTDQPNIPYIPPTLTPRAVERNTLPSMDLLERAADLLDYVVDCEVQRRPIGRAADFTHWAADYRKLCTDER